MITVKYLPRNALLEWEVVLSKDASVAKEDSDVQIESFDRSMILLRLE